MRTSADLFAQVHRTALGACVLYLRSTSRLGLKHSPQRMRTSGTWHSARMDCSGTVPFSVCKVPRLKQKTFYFRTSGDDIFWQRASWCLYWLLWGEVNLPVTSHRCRPQRSSAPISPHTASPHPQCPSLCVCRIIRLLQSLRVRAS